MSLSRKRSTSAKAKRSKSAKTPIVPNPEKTREGVSPLQTVVAIVLGVATLIGVPAGLLALLPRVNVTVSDPPNSDDPFSSSVTVVNSGYIPLRQAQPAVSLHRIETSTNTGIGESDTIPKYSARLVNSAWPHGDMAIDDKLTFSLNDLTRVANGNQLTEAEIAIIVVYDLPLIHWKREKVYPFFAKRQSNGNFYWYSSLPN
jgi:hypothetical protein